ncbi:MAG TPA: pectate lyase [Polyangia bacterium]|nr:pectate lyase [Polyangia bacterium]
MGNPIFARAAGVILLTLAGCDVRVRPIWAPPDSGSTSLYCPDGEQDTVGGWAGPQDPAGDAGSVAVSALPTTTGGGAAAPVTVDAADGNAIDQFKTYADRKSGAAVIHVRGMISFAGFGDSQVRVSSNTTIVGMDDHSGFTGGGLDLVGNSNIIVKNLVIARAVGTDAISIQGPSSTNIWIDHCDLSSEQHPDGTSYDGLVDITHAADAITVSWTVFHDHRDTSIVGHSDSNGSEDTGHLHVTYDHDVFRNVDAGPRIRFGTVHVYNVFFDHVTLYGVASTMGAAVLIEKNYFQAVTAGGQDPNDGPVTTDLKDSQLPGFVSLTQNTLDSTSAMYHITTQPVDLTPPYKYAADTAPTARAVVERCAGPRPVPGAI